VVKGGPNDLLPVYFLNQVESVLVISLVLLTYSSHGCERNRLEFPEDLDCDLNNKKLATPKNRTNHYDTIFPFHSPRYTLAYPPTKAGKSCLMTWPVKSGTDSTSRSIGPKFKPLFRIMMPSIIREKARSKSLAYLKVLAEFKQFDQRLPPVCLLIPFHRDWRCYRAPFAFRDLIKTWVKFPCLIEYRTVLGLSDVSDSVQQAGRECDAWDIDVEDYRE
jgi:hypothetical protein